MPKFVERIYICVSINNFWKDWKKLTVVAPGGREYRCSVEGRLIFIIYFLILLDFLPSTFINFSMKSNI